MTPQPSERPPSAEPTVIGAEPLRQIVTGVLTGNGLERAQAETVAEILVDADLRGVHTHGVARLQMYVDRLMRNMVNRHPQIRTVADTGSLVMLDGDNGMGFVVASRATNIAIERATSHGVGWVTVTRSNHFGAAAYYVEACARRGLIGIAISNGPPVMAPTGSSEPYFGANPLGVGLPCPGDPIVLDMATTVVAQGHILLAAAAGRSIPLGWALDASGQPTTDPKTALEGVLLPFGAHKGSGIALMIEALTGVLGAASFGAHVGSMIKNPDRPQDVSHALIALSLAAVPGAAEGFASRLDGMVTEIRSLTPARGADRILMPGEKEHELRRERLRNGIPLEASTWKRLVELQGSSTTEAR